MVKDSQKRITKFIGIVSFGTFTSRIVGYIRDVLIADRFGAGLVSDAFFTSWRIPNTLRELLGEGALSAAFIPVFTEYLKTKGREQAWQLANLIINALLIISILITLSGIILSPLIISIIAPGFVGKDVFTLTVLLTRITFPFTIFICLAALVMGILNSIQHFTLPAFAPAILNICLILAILFLCPLFGELSIVGLSIGLLIGGLIQLLIQIPPLIKERMEYRLIIDFFHPGVREVIRLMLPRALGAAVTQFNIFISNLLASFLIFGSISSLFYANRLVHFPLAIFGIAIGTVLFPTMSRQVVEGNLQGVKESLRFGLKMVILTSLPPTIGLMVLGRPIIELLFQHGEFDITATNITYLALFFYAFGLLGFSSLKVIVPAFYAQHDTWTPLKIGIISVIANVIFSLLLMKPLEQGGLTLSLSLSGFLNAGLLLISLRQKIGPIGLKEILIFLFNVLLASSMMGFFCGIILKIDIGLFYQVIIGIIGGLIVLFLSCKWLKIKEVDDVWKMVRKK
ncbi:MAG: murein biosynthesis integral membrane protein MurJ [bacterium]